MTGRRSDAAALRVLVVTPFPPRLDGRHGGSKVIAQFLARLAARHTVALLCLRAHNEPGVDERLGGICDLVREVEIPPVGGSFAARLWHRIRRRAALVQGTPAWAVARSAPEFASCLEELSRDWGPDVVQLEYRIMGQFLPALRNHPIPCLIVDHDPESTGDDRPLLELFERRAWNALGRSVFRQVDAVVVFTERDRELVTLLSGSARVTCISLGYELPASPLDPLGTEPNRIVSVGSFIHPPNIDGACWLIREIFPAVKARIPEASLQIVGSHPPGVVRALAGNGVTVHGDVPDMQPYLDAAAVVAAPIRLGAGMRVKVLEALACGKALVATPRALEGLQLEDGEHAVVARTSAEFADALVELLTDAGRRVAIAKAARRWAEAQLDIDVELQAYEDLYSSLIEDAAQTRGSTASGSGG